MKTKYLTINENLELGRSQSHGTPFRGWTYYALRGDFHNVDMPFAAAPISHRHPCLPHRKTGGVDMLKKGVEPWVNQVKKIEQK